jgi:hypothetical protein
MRKDPVNSHRRFEQKLELALKLVALAAALLKLLLSVQVLVKGL